MDKLLTQFPKDQAAQDELLESGILTPEVNIPDDADPVRMAALYEAPNYTTTFYSRLATYVASHEEGEDPESAAKELFESVAASMEMLSISPDAARIFGLPDKETSYVRPDFSFLRTFINHRRRKTAAPAAKRGL